MDKLILEVAMYMGTCYGWGACAPTNILRMTQVILSVHNYTQGFYDICTRLAGNYLKVEHIASFSKHLSLYTTINYTY